MGGRDWCIASGSFVEKRRRINNKRKLNNKSVEKKERKPREYRIITFRRLLSLFLSHVIIMPTGKRFISRRNSFSSRSIAERSISCSRSLVIPRATRTTCRTQNRLLLVRRRRAKYFYPIRCASSLSFSLLPSLAHTFSSSFSFLRLSVSCIVARARVL